MVSLGTAVPLFPHPGNFTLKMEAALTSETLVSYSNTARRHLKHHRRESSKFLNKFYVGGSNFEQSVFVTNGRCILATEYPPSSDC